MKGMVLAVLILGCQIGRADFIDFAPELFTGSVVAQPHELVFIPFYFRTNFNQPTEIISYIGTSVNGPPYAYIGTYDTFIRAPAGEEVFGPWYFMFDLRKQDVQSAEATVRLRYLNWEDKATTYSSSPYTFHVTVDPPTPVPEPGTLVLILSAFALVYTVRRWLDEYGQE